MTRINAPFSSLNRWLSFFKCSSCWKILKIYVNFSFLCNCMLLLIMLHKNVSFLTIQRKWKDFFKFGDSYTSNYENIGQKVYTNITEGKFQKKIDQIHQFRKLFGTKIIILTYLNKFKNNPTVTLCHSCLTTHGYVWKGKKWVKTVCKNKHNCYKNKVGKATHFEKNCKIECACIQPWIMIERNTLQLWNSTFFVKKSWYKPKLLWGLLHMLYILKYFQSLHPIEVRYKKLKYFN